MDIKTKYNFGDEIRYKHIIKYAKKEEVEIRVGIVDAIHVYASNSKHVDKGNVSYSLKHNGGATVKEENIICKLKEE